MISQTQQDVWLFEGLRDPTLSINNEVELSPTENIQITSISGAAQLVKMSQFSFKFSAKPVISENVTKDTYHMKEKVNPISFFFYQAIGVDYTRTLVYHMIPKLIYIRRCLQDEQPVEMDTLLNEEERNYFKIKPDTYQKIVKQWHNIIRFYDTRFHWTTEELREAFYEGIDEYSDDLKDYEDFKNITLANNTSLFLENNIMARIRTETFVLFFEILSRFYNTINLSIENNVVPDKSYLDNFFGVSYSAVSHGNIYLFLKDQKSILVYDFAGLQETAEDLQGYDKHSKGRITHIYDKLYMINFDIPIIGIKHDEHNVFLLMADNDMYVNGSNKCYKIIKNSTNYSFKFFSINYENKIIPIKKLINTEGSICILRNGNGLDHHVEIHGYFPAELVNKLNGIFYTKDFYLTCAECFIININKQMSDFYVNDATHSFLFYTSQDKKWYVLGDNLFNIENEHPQQDFDNELIYLQEFNLKKYSDETPRQIIMLNKGVLFINETRIFYTGDIGLQNGDTCTLLQFVPQYSDEFKDCVINKVFLLNTVISATADIGQVGLWFIVELYDGKNFKYKFCNDNKGFEELDSNDPLKQIEAINNHYKATGARVAQVVGTYDFIFILMDDGHLFSKKYENDHFKCDNQTDIDNISASEEFVVIVQRDSGVFLNTSYFETPTLPETEYDDDDDNVSINVDIEQDATKAEEPKYFSNGHFLSLPGMISVLEHIFYPICEIMNINAPVSLGLSVYNTAQIRNSLRLLLTGTTSDKADKHTAIVPNWDMNNYLLKQIETHREMVKDAFTFRKDKRVSHLISINNFSIYRTLLYNTSLNRLKALNKHSRSFDKSNYSYFTKFLLSLGLCAENLIDIKNQNLDVAYTRYGDIVDVNLPSINEYEILKKQLLMNSFTSISFKE